MHIFLTLFSFFVANIGIYASSVLTKNTTLTGWKILLLPIMLFPIIYAINIFFSIGWVASNKTPLSIAVIGILNLVIGVLVFALAHVFYLKQPMSVSMVAGIVLIISGAILVQWQV